jgi:hypothetical protein
MRRSVAPERVSELRDLGSACPTQFLPAGVPEHRRTCRIAAKFSGHFHSLFHTSLGLIASLACECIIAIDLAGTWRAANDSLLIIFEGLL